MTQLILILFCLLWWWRALLLLWLLLLGGFHLTLLSLLLAAFPVVLGQGRAVVALAAAEEGVDVHDVLEEAPFGLALGLVLASCRGLGLVRELRLLGSFEG